MVKQILDKFSVWFSGSWDSLVCLRPWNLKHLVILFHCPGLALAKLHDVVRKPSPLVRLDKFADVRMVQALPELSVCLTHSFSRVKGKLVSALSASSSAFSWSTESCSTVCEWPLPSFQHFPLHGVLDACFLRSKHSRCAE